MGAFRHRLWLWGRRLFCAAFVVVLCFILVPGGTAEAQAPVDGLVDCTDSFWQIYCSTQSGDAPQPTPDPETPAADLVDCADPFWQAHCAAEPDRSPHPDRTASPDTDVSTPTSAIDRFVDCADGFWRVACAGEGAEVEDYVGSGTPIDRFVDCTDGFWRITCEGDAGPVADRSVDCADPLSAAACDGGADGESPSVAGTGIWQFVDCEDGFWAVTCESRVAGFDGYFGSGTPMDRFVDCAEGFWALACARDVPPRVEFFISGTAIDQLVDCSDGFWAVACARHAALPVLALTDGPDGVPLAFTDGPDEVLGLLVGEIAVGLAPVTPPVADRCAAANSTPGNGHLSVFVQSVGAGSLIITAILSRGVDVTTSGTPLASLEPAISLDVAGLTCNLEAELLGSGFTITQLGRTAQALLPDAQVQWQWAAAADGGFPTLSIGVYTSAASGLESSVFSELLPVPPGISGGGDAQLAPPVDVPDEVDPPVTDIPRVIEPSSSAPDVSEPAGPSGQGETGSGEESTGENNGGGGGGTTSNGPPWWLFIAVSAGVGVGAYWLGRQHRELVVLVVASDPPDEQAIELDEELKKLRQAIEGAEFGKRMRIVQLDNATSDDLVDAMKSHDPTIVYFCGHSTVGYLVMHDAEDFKQSAEVDASALRRLFESHRDRKLRIVVLNSCESFEIGEELKGVVPVVVCATEKVPDEEARVFGPRFIGALASNDPLLEAVKTGQLIIDLRDGTDAFVCLAEDEAREMTLFGAGRRPWK